MVHMCCLYGNLLIAKINELRMNLGMKYLQMIKIKLTHSSGMFSGRNFRAS